MRAVFSGALPPGPGPAFGQPLLADPAMQILYPPTWLNLLFVPGPTTRSSPSATSSSLGSRSTRWRGAGGWPAGTDLAGASAWVLSGPFLSLVDLWHHFASAASIPAVFLAAERAVETRRARDARPRPRDRAAGPRRVRRRLRDDARGARRVGRPRPRRREAVAGGPAPGGGRGPGARGGRRPLVRALARGPRPRVALGPARARRRREDLLVGPPGRPPRDAGRRHSRPPAALAGLAHGSVRGPRAVPRLAVPRPAGRRAGGGGLRRAGRGGGAGRSRPSGWGPSLWPSAVTRPSTTW